MTLSEKIALELGILFFRKGLGCTGGAQVIPAFVLTISFGGVQGWGKPYWMLGNEPNQQHLRQTPYPLCNRSIPGTWYTFIE